MLFNRTEASFKMPRNITHVILADEAANRINNKEIFDNQDAFHMGCVAEDAFLYSLSPHLSSKLHGWPEADTRAVVLEMMDQLNKEKNPAKAAEKKAFIYGYVCHMAADLTFHPLIYSISGSHFKNSNSSESDIELAKTCHRYAETWLDLHLMRDKKLSFKNFRPFRKIVKKLGMRIRLDDFFTDCLQESLNAKKYTWGDNFDLQAQFHYATLRQFFIDKVTQNQTLSKMMRQLDNGLNGKLKLYASGFYNLSGDIPQRLKADSFIHPKTGETIQKSVADLEQDAVECSVKYIKAVDDYLFSHDTEAFLQAVPNVNLDTGTEDKQPFKKKPTQEDYISIKGENETSPNTTKSQFNLLTAFKKLYKKAR